MELSAQEMLACLSHFYKATEFLLIGDSIYCRIKLNQMIFREKFNANKTTKQDIQIS